MSFGERLSEAARDFLYNGVHQHLLSMIRSGEYRDFAPRAIECLGKLRFSAKRAKAYSLMELIDTITEELKKNTPDPSLLKDKLEELESDLQAIKKKTTPVSATKERWPTSKQLIKENSSFSEHGEKEDVPS